MSYTTKRALVQALGFLTWPLAWPARGLYRHFQLRGWFEFCAALLSVIPGRVGQYLRAAFYVQTLNRCAYDFSLGFLSIVTDLEAEFGRGVYIGSLCVIGRVHIDDNVMIASRVAMAPVAGNAAAGENAGNHVVRIGSGCWIGESAIVQADVGAGCVVGAGAVVMEPVAADTTVVGNPARALLAH